MSGLPDLSVAFERAGLVDVAYAVEEGPLGPILLASTARGLVRVAYLNPRAESPDEVLDELARRLSPRVLQMPARLDQARRELDEFFTGRRREFELPLDWALVGSGFTLKVLTQTALIPFGQTVTYKQVAGRAGNDRAYRAAGNALGSNPLPIVVPCHRVLHSDGGLGGYTGGLEIKRALLEIESPAPRLL